MKEWTLGLVFLLSSLACAQQQGPSFSLMLTVKATDNTVRPGTDIVLTIDIKNISDHTITFPRAPVNGSLDLAFQYDVRTNVDERVMQRIATPEESSEVREWSSVLQPKETVQSVAILNARTYDLAAPGMYSIQIARYDPESRQTVLSNLVRVTVDPGISAKFVQGMPQPGLYLDLPQEMGVLSDDDLDVRIMWYNLTNRTVDCTSKMGESGIDEAFVYDVRMRDGRPVPRLPMSPHPEPSSNLRDRRPCSVGPRTLLTYGSLGQLMKAYDMRRPGVYTVQVSRPDPADPAKMLAISNVLTVTVKQAPSYPPLELVLSPDRIEVAPDGDFKLSVKWVNHSGLPLSCFPSSFNSPVDEAFIYDVRDSNGRAVSRLPVEGRPEIDPSGPGCAIGPARNTVETSLGSVMRAFAMRRPGVYTVRVLRQSNVIKSNGSIGSDQVVGISNIVTVTVKDPK